MGKIPYTILIYIIPAEIHPGGFLMLYLPTQEHGQGLVEYGLILVLVATVIVAIVAVLGPQIGNLFSRVTNGISGT